MIPELKSPPLLEKFNVLLVGNNPIELSHVLDNLNKVEGKNVITEIAFDLKSIVERLIKFQPQYILIDDNIGRVALKNMVTVLIKGRKTKDIPITVLKNSNYHEAISTGVLNYVLKENLSGDSLYTALNNSIKFKRTQLFLLNAYKKRKGQLLRLIAD
jgi:hypothetical protein